MSADPFGLPADPEFEARWAELCGTICIECREPLSEHYYHADCATERSISEELGRATTAFLEGMAQPRPVDLQTGPQKSPRGDHHE
jgi:hypothetical protein